MPNDVYEPFNKDVGEFGGYQYARSTQLSSTHSNEHNTRIILRNCDLDGKRVLDVGCGDGTYTMELRTRTKAAHIVGIDPASKAIEAARQRSADVEGIEFKNCFASELLEAGEHFDFAVCRGVIHHVDDPQKEISTILQLADQAFWIDPNGYNLVLKMLERFSAYHREHKERSYRMETFCRWVQSGGNSVDKRFFHGMVPMFCPNWMARVLMCFEPTVERLPLVRRFACGRIAILASAGKE